MTEFPKEGGPPPRQASPALRRLIRPRGRIPVVTYSIIAACVLVYAAQWLSGQSLTLYFYYDPSLTASEPWRMITSTFLHSPSSILHLLLNMYTLYLFGPTVEALVGRVRFLALYLVSGFAGSVAVLLLAPDVVVLGASGAIFGVMAGFFVIQRHLGRNTVQLFVVIALNLAIGFFLPGIAWQAHVGGVVGGAAVAAIYTATRRSDQRSAQVLGVLGVVLGLIALTVLGVLLHA